MYYEVWDANSRNLLYEFETLDEALEAVRELLEVNPEPSRFDPGIIQMDEHHRGVWSAHGDELQALLQQRPAV
ncbi:MAG: hypothetical protein U0893_04470 [Chloroflexota bacterium]